MTCRNPIPSLPPEFRKTNILGNDDEASQIPCWKTQQSVDPLQGSQSSSEKSQEDDDDDKQVKLQDRKALVKATPEAPESSKLRGVFTGRERLKRHRIDMAGRVWIPEIWGQEEFLKDWVDCSSFEASLVHGRIMSARAALIQEGRRANSTRIRIENRC
ncbi:hypothetical protein RJ641_027985 [Dillenia turbinata]|uniref:Protein BIC1 n=1 Tax=Dillenia turbinata TaxID=194707 RepID=A0AAN8VXA7_9MAGN